MPLFDTLLRVAHRGFPREYPGNTMAGFRRGFALGCPMVECDIRRAADGVLVLAHDAHVTAIDGTRYEVGEHPAERLQSLDLGKGEGVPTFAALCAWAAERGAKIMADMKESGGGIEEEVVRLLAPLPRTQKVVPGAPTECRARFRALDPQLPLSLSLGKSTIPDDATFARYLPLLDTDAVTWEWPLLSPERVAALHDRGLFVFAWTVDDPEVMRRLQSYGIDGIISNRADLLREL